MNYRVPTFIDSTSFTTRMKHPVVCSQIKIKSETASKSYNDLFHTFILPVGGDYAHNFAIKSDYIIKGCRDQTLLVDYIGNYIENITLSLNNRTVVVSHVDGVQKIESISAYSLNDKPVVRLDFLNLPLLTKYASETNFIITVKFKQTPPIDYYLSYDIMLTDDASYADSLQHEYFIISYMAQQPMRTSKMVQLSHDRGKVAIF